MLDVTGWGKGVDTKLPFRVSFIWRERLITMKRGRDWELSASGSIKRLWEEGERGGVGRGRG